MLAKNQAAQVAFVIPSAALAASLLRHHFPLLAPLARERGGLAARVTVMVTP